MKIHEKLLKNRFFKHIFQFIQNISEDKLSAFSSEAALFTIISFFPFLMLFFVILSFTSLTPEFIFRLVKDSFPQDIINLIMTVVVQLNNTSTTVISITIFTALWCASRGFMAIERGFNVIYKVDHKKNFIITRLFGLLYTFGFAILLILTLMLLGFGNRIYIAILKHFSFIKFLFSFIVFFVKYLPIFICFYIIYKFFF